MLLPQITLEDMRREIVREQAQRDRVFPRLIRDGLLRSDQADYRRRVFTEVCKVLDAMQSLGGWPLRQNTDD